MDRSSRNLPEQWDVIVVGGALAGGATAMELLKQNPELSVLIVESSEQHGRRVGESTVEVSSYFLARVLGLSGELNRNHISKQGLRLWFANDETEDLADCSELGPKFNVLFPGYQIDRARLDEVVLDKAVSRGAVLKRPAKVVECELIAGGLQRVTVVSDEGRQDLQARWVVDASGVRALLGRKNGWISTNEEHPIATAWSRWRGVLDWDDEGLADELPAWSKRVFGVRNNATNHLVGRGWWAWWIPLQDGDVSIGVVYDQRIVELPSGERLGERLKAMLKEHPAGERLMRESEFVQGDVSFRRNISYASDRVAGDGFVLVGDAAGFLDPFYSPGLDWLCYTVMAGSTLIVDSLKQGETCPKKLGTHNSQFRDSYDRWFRSIYKDKYFYMGDHELMSLAFRLDLGFYYLAVVTRPYLLGAESLRTPSFGQKEAKWPAIFLSFYNRRLAAIGRKRMRSGRFGRRNSGHFESFFSYRLNWMLPLRIAWALARYGWLELRELFSTGGTGGDDNLKPQEGRLF
ncbi:NAD(P)/FAD-dependent oxidoreductase [Pelagicoccus sp. SDUM812002]|uniref:NAD(P)/FAD-dependent oxidoreductase n=1 Tax=Pelagicoccus sp. SDUM812002 TaxID=3041266 RepID=UPI00280F7D54|nr:NAD(P)/FAD-dependent oxidoreductase [Pelagicoccus sp. SDUM812002]MDQ8186356.1 NAD(P)/FAD-dependent oxidoreductase [Pelagicoccus sp. SDUM812002]